MAKQGFISWSGEGSRKIAEQLQKLFAHVLAAPTMFVASKDLKAGEVWFTEIANRLDLCDVGVIVVTPENLTKPWLHFEAGAIAKRVGRAAAIPLLCGVSTGQLSGTPLAQLQAITTSEDDIRGLCHRLNELLELNLTETHISEGFPVWWERLGSGVHDPKAWKTSAGIPREPTLSDLTVQLSQLSAGLAELTEHVRGRGRAGLLKLAATPETDRERLQRLADRYADLHSDDSYSRRLGLIGEAVPNRLSEAAYEILVQSAMNDRRPVPKADLDGDADPVPPKNE